MYDGILSLQKFYALDARWAAQVMTLGEPRGAGGLAGTATGYAFVLHGFECSLFYPPNNT